MMFNVIYDLKYTNDKEYDDRVYDFHCDADNAMEAAKKCVEFYTNEFHECRALAVDLVNVFEYKAAMSDRSEDLSVWKEYDKKERKFRDHVAVACGDWEDYQEKNREEK